MALKSIRTTPKRKIRIQLHMQTKNSVDLHLVECNSKSKQWLITRAKSIRQTKHMTIRNVEKKRKCVHFYLMPDEKISLNLNTFKMQKNKLYLICICLKSVIDLFSGHFAWAQRCCVLALLSIIELDCSDYKVQQILMMFHAERIAINLSLVLKTSVSSLTFF